MIVHTEAPMHFMTSPETVYDLMVDAARFPRIFPGYGPIPAIRAVLLDGALRVGGTRRIANSDGSVLTEMITRLDRPASRMCCLASGHPSRGWLRAEKRTGGFRKRTAGRRWSGATRSR